jgi:hypothetical protein
MLERRDTNKISHSHTLTLTSFRYINKSDVKR